MCKKFVKPAETLPIVAGNKHMANDLLKSIMSKNCFNFSYSIVRTRVVVPCKSL